VKIKPIIRRTGIYMLFLAAGVATLLLGMIVPYYFRGLAPALVRKAGEGTTQARDIAQDLTSAGRISAVFELSYVLADLRLENRLIDLARDNPAYYFSGGHAPYVEEVVRRLGIDPKAHSKPTTVVALFTPKTHRDYIHDLLSRSRNAHVQQILKSRNLKGTVILSSVDSPSGAPMDVAILTAALLVQAEEVSRRLAAEIGDLCTRAMGGDVRAIDELEQTWLALLSLGKRMQWVTLAEWMRHMNSLESMRKAAALIRQYPDHKSLFFAATMLHGDPNLLYRFTERYGKEAIRDLQDAVPQGKGAVGLLFDRMAPIYRPKAWNGGLEELQQALMGTRAASIALQRPQLTGVIKLMLLFTSGLCMIILLRLILSNRDSHYRSWLAGFFANAGNITVAFAYGVVAWLVLEPEFLKQAQTAPPPIQLQIASVQPFSNLKSELMNQVKIDQVTLLILGLFFVLQSGIYAYSRVRLQEIKRTETTPDIKLKLIENEDNLFDSGLYVGLGGTVASLIMIAMNIVEASLMAAYASTLFGIIFVAVLKIFNVRPYRKELILEARPPETPARPISTLKLK
jgi:hypothetical protein